MHESKTKIPFHPRQQSIPSRTLQQVSRDDSATVNKEGGSVITKGGSNLIYGKCLNN